MSKPIKVGLVGLGRSGWGMFDDLLKGICEGMYEVVATCDIIPERTAEAKELYGCREYDCIEKLVQDEEVELVIIATRSIDHFKHAMLALKAGKNVVIEKPVSINIGLAEELLSYAERPDTPKLYLRQNRRFETMFNEVLDKINSGILGTVYEIDIEQRGYERRDDWQTLHEFGGGLILNWGPHIVDHACVLLDSEVREQFGHMQRCAAGGDREDHFSMHLIGENGRKVNVWISGASALNSGRSFTVYGNRGAMVCNETNVKLRYINPQQVLPEVVSSAETPINHWGASGTFEAVLKPDWIEKEYEVPFFDGRTMWKLLYEDYNGIGKYPITYDEARRYMKVITNLRDGQKIWDMTANRDKI